MKLFYLIIFLLIYNNSFALNIGSNTGYELPRYVSVKSNESNVRVGPSKNYPILIKYIKENFPLKVIEEYKDWRKVSDFQNNEGWIHKSLIKGERTGIIVSKNQENIYIFNTVGGKIIGEISTGSIINLSKCKTNWCLITKDKKKGWIPKDNIWGVKEFEVFNISYFQIIIDYYNLSLAVLEFYIFSWLGR